MCGICGFISKKNISRENLIEMNNTMYHRGPDDSGEVVFKSDDFNIGLAHRRLSILDLTSAGHQPMLSKDKNIMVVFNGEIYNYNEIKKVLDYDFTSSCDTEVIIAAYLKWGISCIEKFNGMFAIAIYDKTLNKLFLCRDRIGKKPLYYWIDGCNIVFASELKPIMKLDSFIPLIDKTAVSKFMYYQYIPAPQTIFKNVYKVEPGEIVSFQKGKIEKCKYWNVIKNLTTSKLQYEDAKQVLKQMLLESCKKRMISDVPLGVFLSGGIDSSLVAALMQSISSVPIKTFSIGFNEKDLNEADRAKLIAKHLGTSHKELYLDDATLISFLDNLPYYYDEPFSDDSQIATMAVAKLAKKDVTVALSGDGGDELFCGYANYKSFLEGKLLRIIIIIISNIFKYTGLKNIKSLRKHLPDSINLYINSYKKESKTQFAVGFYQEIFNKLLDSSTSSNLYYNEAFTNNDVFNRMLLDQITYLPSDILCKVDRASMRYSLETRCPLLDYEVVEFANSLPFSYKYKDKIQKRILKDLAYDFIPKELLDIPKKGFGIPTKKLLLREKEKIFYYADIKRLKEQGLFNPEPMNKFINDYFGNTLGQYFKNVNPTNIVWSFYILQMWFEYYKIR